MSDPQPWQVNLITANPIPHQELQAGIADTQLGQLLVVTHRGIICMLYPTTDKSGSLRKIRERWPDAKVTTDDHHASRIAQSIIEACPSRPQMFDLMVQGSPFQLDVWKALLSIPHGTTVSYRQVATMAGHPTAIRAVGTAIGRNPIALIIPCHRVIRNDGSIGNYRWGPALKQTLLEWEAKQVT